VDCRGHLIERFVTAWMASLPNEDVCRGVGDRKLVRWHARLGIEHLAPHAPRKVEFLGTFLAHPEKEGEMRARSRAHI
jgi:hypothetical protein